MLTVIIIDDEEFIRNLIKKIIPWRQLEMAVIGEASNGIDGFNLCNELHPDIIITDIRMPGLDGVALLEKLRSEGIMSEVIIISGYDDFTYAQKAIKSGIFDYILKPIEEEDLIKILERAKSKKKKIENDKDYVLKLKREVKKLQSEYVDSTINTITSAVSINNNAIIQKALLYIEDNYNSDISLDDIAQKLFMHNTYFSELFKKEVGKGFNTYLTEFRMDKAKILLKFPHLKINEVADMVGYRNASYFNKLFHKYIGVTPCDYREKNK